MKSRSNTITSSIKFLAGLLLIAVVAFGCQKEIIRPESAGGDLQAYLAPPSFRAISPCGQSMFTSFQSGSVVLGDAEISNDGDFMYVTIHMAPNSFMDELQVFSGEASTVPVDVTGAIDFMQFGFTQSMGSPTSDMTVVIPVAGLPACPDIIIHSTITTIVPNTLISTTEEVWASGTTLYNGQMNSFCLTICPTDDTSI